MVFERGPGIASHSVSAHGLRVEIKGQAPAAIFFGYRPSGTQDIMASKGRLLHFVPAQLPEQRALARAAMFLAPNDNYGLRPPAKAPQGVYYEIQPMASQPSRPHLYPEHLSERPALPPSLAGTWTTPITIAPGEHPMAPFKYKKVGYEGKREGHSYHYGWKGSIQDTRYENSRARNTFDHGHYLDVDNDGTVDVLMWGYSPYWRGAR